MIYVLSNVCCMKTLNSLHVHGHVEKNKTFTPIPISNQIHRLDQILGKQGSKAKDVYASKISLASRVVKVERSVRKKTLLYEKKKNANEESF